MYQSRIIMTYFLSSSWSTWSRCTGRDPPLYICTAGRYIQPWGTRQRDSHSILLNMDTHSSIMVQILFIYHPSWYRYSTYIIHHGTDTLHTSSIMVQILFIYHSSWYRYCTCIINLVQIANLKMYIVCTVYAVIFTFLREKKKLFRHF